MKEITVTARTTSLDEVLEFIDSETDVLGCSRKTATQLSIAVEEIFTNISNYACTKNGYVCIIFDLDKTAGDIVITFIDDGNPYNPLKNPDPDLTLSAARRNIGGLGIFLVKKTMNSITYEYKNNQNFLTMRKSLY